jgi:predicted Zn finger-like uncharacterized protein
MIIQCGQCRTKFRFADDLMEGDGVWVRCSRCQHVFFQENQQPVKPCGQSIKKEEPFLPEETVAEQKAPDSGLDGDSTLLLGKVTNMKDDSNQELFPEIEKPLNEENSEEENIITRGLTAEEDKQKTGKSRKGFWKVLMIAAWIVAVIVIIPAIIYFFVFPQMGERLLKVVNQYVDIGARQPARPEIVAGQVKLQDIRQRILNNYILGPIRIVEGTAVNQADYPISRIAIKGEIVDAYAVVLGEQTTYSGNVLTDEELMTLPEEAILTNLARQEGNNNSNDKIMPNGMIPFMIVFVREPAGVIKTTVKTVGAERLL